jgi:hypothetical protein
LLCLDLFADERDSFFPLFDFVGVPHFKHTCANFNNGPEETASNR